MVIEFKKFDLLYNNTSYQFKNENIRIDFTFGLLEIIINNRVVYSRVHRINGLTEQEKLKMVYPVIIDVLFNHNILIQKIKVKQNIK